MDKVTVWGADTLTGKKVEVDCDLVVLATAMVPTAEKSSAHTVKTAQDENGWFAEAHPKLDQLKLLSAGFYLAGAVKDQKIFPKPLPGIIAAASKVVGFFSSRYLQHAPLIAGVDEDICSGCGLCVDVCPYKARELSVKEDGKNKK